MEVKGHHIAGATLLFVAGGLVYLGTRTAGNVQMNQFVETHLGPMQVQHVSTDELNMSRVFTAPKYPMHYPDGVAGGVSRLVNLGFAPLWAPVNPQVAAMPAEVP